MLIKGPPYGMYRAFDEWCAGCQPWLASRSGVPVGLSCRGPTVIGVANFTGAVDEIGRGTDPDPM